MNTLLEIMLLKHRCEKNAHRARNPNDCCIRALVTIDTAWAQYIVIVCMSWAIYPVLENEVKYID